VPQTLFVEVGGLLVVMAAAMLCASLLISDLARVYAAGFWGRRAGDRGEPSARRAYQGPERRRRDVLWFDVV